MIYLFLVAMCISCTVAIWHGFTHPVEPIFWLVVVPMALVIYGISALGIWAGIIIPEMERYRRNKKPQP